jgi:hypothetical protein
MMKKKRRQGRELPAAEGALQLGMSRERLVRLIQSGELAGRRDSDQGWLVAQAAVEQRLRRRMKLGGPRAGAGGHHG